jgi:hypothetical protein
MQQHDMIAGEELATRRMIVLVRAKLFGGNGHRTQRYATIDAEYIAFNILVTAVRTHLHRRFSA